jgi:alkanesulfonate monooxygenase SsuD/methylene tetrahydromethanopterin reductase-like flavin-dependent oxidoreductase (luciferase family)
VQFAFLTPDGVRSALEEVRAGMREAERETVKFDVVIRIPIAVNEPDAVRELARRYVMGYAAVPTYEAALQRQGLGDAAAPSVQVWRVGDRTRAVSLLPDEVVDAFFVRGTPDECSARLNEYADAGVRTAILMHLSIGATPEQRAERIAAQLEALAPTPIAEDHRA